MAVNVLHNVGNVLNSVNVSAELLSENIRQSRVSYLNNVAGLLSEHREDLGKFITHDEKGKRLPDFLSTLAEQTRQEQQTNVEEIDSLIENIEHIKAIVRMQQDYSSLSDLREPCDLNGLMDNALRFADVDEHKHGITVVRDYGELPEIEIVRGKLLQVLVNLIKNANAGPQETV